MFALPRSYALTLWVCFGLTDLRALEAQSATRTVLAQGHAFDVPARWQDLPPTSASCLSVARDPVARGGFATNVNLNAEPYPGDAMTYARAAVAGIATLGQVNTQRAVMYNSIPGLLVESTWRGGAVPYRTMQFITASRGVGYVLTCTASVARYRAETPVCSAILRSFRAASAPSM